MASTTSSADYALARFGLTDLRCLVTGATKGLGAAVVEELAALGAKARTSLQYSLHHAIFWRRCLCAPATPMSCKPGCRGGKHRAGTYRFVNAAAVHNCMWDNGVHRAALQTYRWKKTACASLSRSVQQQKNGAQAVKPTHNFAHSIRQRLVVLCTSLVRCKGLSTQANQVFVSSFVCLLPLLV